MKEQTRLELNISSLVWENWDNQNRDTKETRTWWISHKSICNTTSCRFLVHGRSWVLFDLFVTYIPHTQPTLPPNLVFDVCVLEHQGQWGDVLLVHTFTAANLNCMFDAFVNLLGG